jgi:hypothetical protein
VYLYVEDVDRIIPAGAVAEDCPWGMREARLTDPDGNEVRVGSRSAIRNLQPQPDEQQDCPSLAGQRLLAAISRWAFVSQVSAS